MVADKEMDHTDKDTVMADTVANYISPILQEKTEHPRGQRERR